MDLYEVRDGESFIGAYYAKSERHAIQRALEGANEGAGAFRKSWTRITFSNPTAKRIAAIAKAEGRNV